MKHKQASLIFGTAVSAAAIAVAIDHTRHTLPEFISASGPGQQQAASQAVIIIDEGEEIPDNNMDNCNKAVADSRSGAPCSL